MSLLSKMWQSVLIRLEIWAACTATQFSGKHSNGWESFLLYHQLIHPSESFDSHNKSLKTEVNIRLKIPFNYGKVTGWFGAKALSALVQEQ